MLGLKLIHVSKRAPDIAVPNCTRPSSVMTACTVLDIFRRLSRFNSTVWQPANVIHNGRRNHGQSIIPVLNTSACSAQIWSSLSLQISAPRVVELVASKALQYMLEYTIHSDQWPWRVCISICNVSQFLTTCFLPRVLQFYAVNETMV